MAKKNKKTKSTKNNANNENNENTTEKFNNTLPIDETVMKVTITLLKIIMVISIIGLSFAKGLNSYKVFDMSIVHFLVTHPAFIFISLFFIVAIMYYKYASKMEQWLYYCMGSGGSAPWFIGIFTFIIFIDIFFGINFGKGFIERVISLSISIATFIISPIIGILLFLIFLVFTLLNIRMSGVFFIIYLYIYSFFGMILYGGDKGISGCYKQINDLILNAINNDGKDCESNGAVEQFVRYILSNVYDSMYLFLFIIILISGIFTYYKHMKSGAKAGFIFINTIVLVVTVVGKILYTLYKRRTSDKKPDDYDMD
jgi:hypothetical protein